MSSDVKGTTEKGHLYTGPCAVRNREGAVGDHLGLVSLVSSNPSAFFNHAHYTANQLSRILELLQVFTMENVADVIPGIDKWAAPTTQVFAFIGLLWLSTKIFSFWRLIASLFILPGANVRNSVERAQIHYC